MKKQINDILDYFENRQIKDFKIEIQDNIMGKKITTDWEESFIRCQCTIFSTENADEKMQKQFEMTRQILIQNIKK